MAQIKPVTKVKLLIGAMYKEKEILDKTIGMLKERFGVIESTLEYSFDFTDYYEEETGKELKKQLLIFKVLIDRELLADIKNWTNEIEGMFSEKDKRKINLDPGYLTMHNVVLASAKEMPHKIYIGKGMFGDVVLEYKSKSFQHSNHTFPDFKSDKVKEFLNKARENYKKEIK